MSFFDANLALLAAADPLRAERIRHAPDDPALAVEEARSGAPVPRIGETLLHSAYYPEKEGERFGAGNDAPPSGAPVAVYGFGFGYHLDGLAQRDDLTITVIEPNDALLKAAFARRDLTGLLSRVTLADAYSFTIAAEGWDYRKARWLDHPPSARLSPSLHQAMTEVFSARSFNAAAPLRVMVVGPIYGGTVPTARSLARAFTRLGCVAELVDHTPHQPEYFGIDRLHPDPAVARGVKNAYLTYLGERTAARVLAFAPDLIVATAQAPLTERTLAHLRGYGSPMAFWFVENHRTIASWKALAPLYDYFFALQKGPFLDMVAAAGAPVATWLPQAADDEIFTPAPLTGVERKTYGAPLSFMGAGYPNRRRFFAELLDLPLALWGTEWDLSTALGRRVRNANRRLDPTEFVKIYRATEVNLNLHSSLNPDGVEPAADFVNPRTFEIPAAGAFQLVDERDELPEMFAVGREVVTFRTMADLREKIAHYRDRPDERAAIAQAGRRRVVTEHTVVHRAARMLATILPREAERIRANRTQRIGVNDVDRLIAETTDPALASFLAPLAGTGKVSFKKLMERIGAGEGPLTRTEQVIVMMNEVFS